MRRSRDQSGFTVFEVATALGLMGVMASMALAGLSGYAGQNQSAASMIHGFVKEVRAKAIAGAGAYRITATSLDTLQAAYGESCSASRFAPDETMTLQLPRHIRFIGMGWSVCVSAAERSSRSTVVILQGDDGARTRVEIAVSGR